MTTMLETPAVNLDEALRAYSDYRLQFSRNTWAGEKSTLLGFVDTVGATCPLGELTTTAVDLWWGQQAELAKSTRKTRLSQVRSFLAFCTAKGWLPQDPSRFIHVGRVGLPTRRRLTRHQLLMLLELAENPRDRCLLALAMNLALRGSEIADLRVRDVNLEDAEITVTVEKTGHETDVMPITVELDLELRRWLAVYRAECPAAGTDSYLVPSRFYQPRSGIATWRHDRKLSEPYTPVKDALTRLGWETTRYEGVHTIRRSMARIAYDLMLEDNDPEALVTVMRLLHHTDSATTLRYIGYDRQTEARDRFLKRRRFLTRGSDTSLRLVSGV